MINLYDDPTRDITPMDAIDQPVNPDSISGSTGEILPGSPVSFSDKSRLGDAPLTYGNNSWGSKLFPNGIQAGDIADLGKLAIGLYGATGPVSSYSRPASWVDYMNRMNTLSRQGFTPEEYSLAKQNAERGYNYDVHNILNSSGGNAGVVLGNLGRATGSLYNNQAELAARDAALHRQNLQNYGNVVGADTNMERQIFEDKLRQQMMNKQSGAGLASDALYNLHNRDQFNNQYGANSSYAKYQKAITDSINAQTNALNEGRRGMNQYLDQQGTSPVQQNSIPLNPNPNNVSNTSDLYKYLNTFQ